MLGILAGMGPKSTAPFISKVVELCQTKYGAIHDMDFPPRMIHSCPTPFYLDRPLDHQAMETATVEGIRKLSQCGCDCIAVPCNTVHQYYDRMQAASGVPVFHMVRETLKRMPGSCARVAVLATEATIRAEVYQQGLREQHLQWVYEPEWQRDVNQIIGHIKTGTDLTQGKIWWRALLKKVGQMADGAIVACTDLDLVADNETKDILPLVDSSAALAAALVDFYYQGKCG